jgi:glutamate/tyrosine decarboxylase-like PLP-dependent enzyme
MLKPPHPIAQAAYAMAMLINPNNHALDGGPATAALEREAVALMAAMVGYGEHLGHLTSSGTIANLEALWVSRELHPGKAIAYSTQAHYTHPRMCDVLGVRGVPIAVDAHGRMDLADLDAKLATEDIGTVVVTLGTTGLGALDPLERILERGVRVHVDAAYGGYFRLLADLDTPMVAAAPFLALERADSIVIDPHKHGLQPYGCGCVLFADPGVGRLYAHDSPYTYFTSDALHLGEISLECSRAGAAAAALWATLRALPLTRAGLGRHLAAARSAALELAGLLDADERTELVLEPELDIVCVRSATDPDAAERAFDTLAEDGWHVAKLRLDDGTTVLRCCLLKQEHAGIARDLAAVLAEHLTRDR